MEKQAEGKSPHPNYSRLLKRGLTEVLVTESRGRAGRVETAFITHAGGKPQKDPVDVSSVPARRRNNYRNGKKSPPVSASRVRKPALEVEEPDVKL